MSAPAGTNGPPKKGPVAPVVPIVPAVHAHPPPPPHIVKPTVKPAAASQPPPSKPKKDDTIALAAGAVVVGGIAWSLYKSFQGKKQEPELGVDIVSGSGQPGEGEADEGGFPSPSKSLSSTSYKFNATKIYEVSKGDTLWSLAGQYNTSVDALKSINGLTGDSIHAGDTLTVPK